MTLQIDRHELDAFEPKEAIHNCTDASLTAYIALLRQRNHSLTDDLRDALRALEESLAKPCAGCDKDNAAQIAELTDALVKSQTAYEGLTLRHDTVKAALAKAESERDELREMEKTRWKDGGNEDVEEVFARNVNVITAMHELSGDWVGKTANHINRLRDRVECSLTLEQSGSLIQQNANLQAELAALKAAIADHKCEKILLSDDIVRAMFDDFRRDAEHFDAKIAGLIATLATAENERDAALNSCGRISANNEMLRGRIAAVDDELAALKSATVPPHMEIRATHPYGFRSGEWALVLGVGQMAGSEPRDSIIVQFSDGEIDTWPVKDPLDPYETRDVAPRPLAVPPQWQGAIDAANARIAELADERTQFINKNTRLETIAQTFDANKRAVALDHIELNADLLVAQTVCDALQSAMRAMHIISITKAGK